MSPQAWEQWLEQHYSEAEGLWLKIAKAKTGIPSVTYAEALEVALCYGWIDGQKQKFDDEYWLQKFTPRRKKSPWSQRNKDIVAGLIAAGRMREAGQREIDRAKADGRWENAYASQSKIEIPADFQAAMDQNPAAKAFFATLSSVNRYAVLYRITTAKKSETRQKRIDKFIDMLNKGEKIYS
jgi:uncharacterized protein YdeI (YjbR/CyaY-like superfamily)